MILIDRRAGSRDYLPLIPEAELAGIDLATDAQWSGLGPDGEILIGAELKTINELLSSLRDGRLAGQQIELLIENYQVRYLVIAGWWRPSAGGFIEIAHDLSCDPDTTYLRWHLAWGCHRYDATIHAIETICQHGGITPVFLDTEAEAALWLKTTHDWWQQPWESHTTSATLYIPPIPWTAKEAAARSIHGLTGKPRWKGKATIIEAWLHALPHMGRKAVTLAPHFKLPRDIVYQQDWRDFDGIGKASAKDIRDAIHGVQPI